MQAGADVAVIGAGIVGLATAYALSEQDAPVTVYERGVPGNGQSGGESRIFRHAHDDRRLVDFAVQARSAWREWEEQFGTELLSRDGVVALGPAAERRLEPMRQAGVRAYLIDADEVEERLPLLASGRVSGVLDEDAGVIRTRASIDALTGALGERIVFDEVLSVRATPSGTVEVRAGGSTTEHGRVVVCAGRGTSALARGAGLPLPVRQAAHARLTYLRPGRASRAPRVPARFTRARPARSAPTPTRSPATLHMRSGSTTGGRGPQLTTTAVSWTPAGWPRSPTAPPPTWPAA